MMKSIKYNLKILNKVKVVLAIWFVTLGTTMSSQDLYIKVPIDDQGNFEALYESEMLIAESFKVGLNLPNIVSNCDKLRITYNLPSELQFINVLTPGFILITHHNNTVVIESDSNTTLDGNANLDMSFRVSYSGNVCENISVDLNASLEYLDSDSNICSTYNYDPISITPKYDSDTHEGFVIDNTYNLDLCLGGYHRNTIYLSALNREGGYSLNNVTGSMVFDAELLSINCSDPSFDHQVSTLGYCSTTIDFTIDEWKINTGIQINLVYSSACLCNTSASIPYTNDIEVNITGDDPCGTVRNVTIDFNNPLSQECCQEATVSPLYSEGLEFNSLRNWCSSDCYNYDFVNKYYNNNSPFSIKQYTVEHQIPDGLNLKFITVDNNYGYLNTIANYPVEFCYTLSSSSLSWICQTVDETNIPIGRFLFTDTPANYNYMTFYKGAGDQVEKIKWKYLYEIPAWHHDRVVNSFSFTLEDNSPIPGPLQSQVFFDRYLNGTFHETVSFSPEYEFPTWRCGPDYKTYSFVNATNFPNQSVNTASSFPTDVESLAIKIENRGSGSQSEVLEIQLPDQFEYVGNMTIYEGLSSNLSPQFNAVPSSEDILFAPATNILTWQNMSVPELCDSDLFCKILKFDVRVRPGTYTGTYKTDVVLDSRSQDSHFIHVLEKLLVKGYISRSCTSGAEVLNDIEVAAGEEIQLKYYVSNEGNVKIRDILVSSMIPSIDDFSFQANNTANLSRNSEIDFQFSTVQPSYVGMDVGFHPSVTDVEVFQGSNNNVGENTFQAFLPGEILPGDSRHIPLNISIPNNVAIGDRAYNDFYYYGYDASVVNTDLPIAGLSELTNFLIADINNCPMIQDCAENSDLDSRLQNAFNISVTNNQVEVNANNLYDNERWFPIWEGSSNGGSGYQWGDGDYPSSYTYSTSGNYDICIVVENMQYEDVEDNTVCHCSYYCQTITIQ